MTLQIGRITGLNEPNVWASHDGTITLTGSYKATSLTDGLVRRDQLLGYWNNQDEPIIPIILAGEPRVTGYYRVMGVSVDTDEFVRKQGNLYDYSLTLQAVPGYAQPMMEDVVNGALLTNAVGAVSGDMLPLWFPPPGSVEYFYPGSGIFGYTRFNVDSLSGLITGYATIGVTIPVSAIAHYYVAPASYYLGAATVSQGTTLQPLVGRMMVQPDVTHWLLSNGSIRVSLGVNGVFVETWTGAAWIGKTYILSDASGIGNLLSNTSSFTILRNSPELAIVRLQMPGQTTAGGRLTLDLSLRRGDTFIRGYLNADIAGQWKWALASGEAGTAITYGAVTAGAIVATTATSNLKYFLASYQQAMTSDLVNGALTATGTRTNLDVCFGGVSTLVGAVDTGTNLAKNYLAAQDESVRIVSR